MGLTFIGALMPKMLPFARPDAVLAVAGIPLARPRPDEVHVWSWTLAATAETTERFAASLTPDEQARGFRFHRPGDRVRHVLAHGILRHVLARYCGCAPAALVFAHAAGGKPWLAVPESTDLTFNLAHSADRALLAVATTREVGIDLEQERADLDSLEIADRYFLELECVAIRAAPPAERQPAFLRHWVAKEAVLKADGIGLALPLDSFGVRFTADGVTARVVSSVPERLQEDWLIRTLPLDAGWHGAIAARGEDWQARHLTATDGSVPG